MNCAQEVVPHPVDLHEHLVEMPAPMPERPHRLDPATSYLGREDGAELVPPAPHHLMRDMDAALYECRVRAADPRRPSATAGSERASSPLGG